MKHRSLKCRLLPFLLLLAALLANTGCSGINASKSFSPLDFLLPGILQNLPAAPSISEPQSPALTMAQFNESR